MFGREIPSINSDVTRYLAAISMLAVIPLELYLIERRLLPLAQISVQMKTALYILEFVSTGIVGYFISSFLSRRHMTLDSNTPERAHYWKCFQYCIEAVVPALILTSVVGAMMRSRPDSKVPLLVMVVVLLLKVYSVLWSIMLVIAPLSAAVLTALLPRSTKLEDSSSHDRVNGSMIGYWTLTSTYFFVVCFAGALNLLESLDGYQKWYSYLSTPFGEVVFFPLQDRETSIIIKQDEEWLKIAQAATAGVVAAIFSVLLPRYLNPIQRRDNRFWNCLWFTYLVVCLSMVFFGTYNLTLEKALTPIYWDTTMRKVKSVTESLVWSLYHIVVDGGANIFLGVLTATIPFYFLTRFCQSCIARENADKTDQ
eukprot:TRINITY_DN11690_c0_g1_i1.p1 TRINITY_DN11690_c0_g1~~TRINITY_DN11690_c0_g1_i1.p1  ORF type:complete len:368 (+),score=23.38 TRINITY_DN11690_c0_g1_i1:22-1125(+)